MKISLNWLREYVSIRLSAEKLAETLTMAGLEVESIEHQGRKYEKFVVGEVLDVRKHPHADRLSVCRVGTGKEELTIICGAPNVAPDQKVPVGLAGAYLPRNHSGKPAKLERVAIRGVDSEGMICSAYELDLGSDQEGILVLDPKARVGSPLAEYLNLTDTIFEIGVTPNRPDCLSHIGVAREVSALTGQRLKIPRVKIGKTTRSGAVVKIADAEGCPRYTARVVLNVTIGDSPQWMQTRLNAVGVRPVNNIVDITNYVLMECGHPLHAFDYDELEGHKLVIQRVTGEKFITLDHRERVLDDTLMICDSVKPVAIAGVMGGVMSEISQKTKKILIESAYFSPKGIRRTSKRFLLGTEASQRFERGADPGITRWAADRAASLTREIAGGTITKEIDVYPKKIAPRMVSLRQASVKKVLGLSIPAPRISATLGLLQITTLSRRKERTVLRIPTFRPDLEREIDLIEEVARIHGYQKIPLSPSAMVTLPQRRVEPDFLAALRSLLIGRGFYEIVANSMQEKAVAEIASSDFVTIANPISRDMAALRTSLIPGALSIMRHNIFHGTPDLRLFEVGRAYFRRAGRYIEEERLMMALSGKSHPRSWDEPGKMSDIFDIKGEVEGLLYKILLDKIKFIPYPTTDALTEFRSDVEIHGEKAGFIGSVRSDIRNRYEIEQDVFVSEIGLDAVRKHAAQSFRFKELPKFPSVSRDIAVIVDDQIPVGAVDSEIRAAGGPLLTAVELFDIYSGEQIQGGKKSCAFALKFNALDRTLEQDEIDHLMQNIITQLEQKLKASIRKQA